MMRGNPGFAVLVERRIFQLQRTVKYDAQQLRTRTIDRLDEYALCFRDESNLRSFREVIFFSISWVWLFLLFRGDYRCILSLLCFSEETKANQKQKVSY